MRLQVDAIVALALHCGLRRAEIFQLKPDDLHYDNEYIVVVGKGGKVREVPFTEAARTAVQRWLDFRFR
jgi:integrase/recombinase XerC